MNDERTRIANIGEVGEESHIGNELHAGVVTALQPECKHRAGALRYIFLGERVILVAWEPCVAHPRNFRTLRQPFGDRQRIVTVALHAERQCLDAGENEEGIEWRQRGPEIAQPEHTAGDRERKVAEGLVQDNALIFGAGFRKHWIFLVARPVEGATVNDQSADRVAVAAQKLRERMHDNVRAVVYWLA